MLYDNYSIAVLVPCYNEELTVAQVIADFRQVLPQAQIFVYDNNSTDRTMEVARKAGAIVRSETLQGKGNVIRRMFADIDCDIYVMVDGDCTYPADRAPELINALIQSRSDMVVGTRQNAEHGAYRPMHDLGNKVFNIMVRQLFGRGMNDIFSGYRIFSRRFVKSFPALSRGFETETELSVHALELNLPFGEIGVPYLARPEGSFSKLSTYKDGWRILGTVISLFKETKPFKLFSLIALAMLLLAVILGYPLVVTWLETHLVPRIPTAFIVIGLLVSATISFTSGIILDGIAQLRRENKRLHYLKHPALP